MLLKNANMPKKRPTLMHIAFIGIGSNLGDRQKSCEEAIKLLAQDGVTKIVRKSRWYETKAVSGERLAVSKQPDFINGVVKTETSLLPIDLLRLTQSVEAKLGRVRTGKKWEPRTIDLDILFYDDLVLDMPELKIPHPELHKRMFVLEPMCEIAPDWKHPVINKTIRELCALPILR